MQDDGGVASLVEEWVTGLQKTILEYLEKEALTSTALNAKLAREEGMFSPCMLTKAVIILWPVIFVGQNLLHEIITFARKFQPYGGYEFKIVHTWCVIWTRLPSEHSAIKNQARLAYLHGCACTNTLLKCFLQSCSSVYYPCLLPVSGLQELGAMLYRGTVLHTLYLLWPLHAV